MTLDLRGVRVIDTDTHLTEPHDLWTKQAPASRRDRVPHVTDVEGAATWVIGDDVLGRAGGGGVIGRDGSKINAQKGLFEWTIDDIHQGAYDPRVRVEMMDEMGIWAEVLYPNVIGLGGQGIASIVQDPSFRLSLLQMYNDHMGQVQAASGTRLLPMGVLPSWSVAESVAEAQRVRAMGFRGVNMTCDPQDLGAPDLASTAWDPLWAACSTLELPVHFHIGASLTTMNFFGNYPWPSQQQDVALGIGGTLLFVGNARVVVNIICSGLLDRFPDLKMVSVESGCGWIPFILEALDYEMEENAPSLAAELSLRPSEYFRRQLYATTWFERRNLPNVVAAVGEDNIMFETDFPHPTCLFPDPLKTAAQNMASLSPAVQRKILSENGVVCTGCDPGGGAAGTVTGRLTDRVAVITGAGDGIGAGIARRFAAEGARVVVTDIDEEAAAGTAVAIDRRFGAPARHLRVDVRDREQVRAMVEGAVEWFGTVDIVVNNAWGGGELGRLEHKTDELMAHGMSVAYFGPFWAMQAAFPVMRAQGRGNIVNLCSLNGVNAHIGTAEYNGAKEALRALTRTAAREWAPYGIVANVICPGAKTAAFRRVAASHPEIATMADAANPMGRLGDPDTDIAPVAVFLASDDARYLTGNTLFVDGGSHINGAPWAPELPD